jgi:hypothetical protein
MGCFGAKAQERADQHDYSHDMHDRAQIIKARDKSNRILVDQALGQQNYPVHEKQGSGARLEAQRWQQKLSAAVINPRDGGDKPDDV